MSDVLVHAEGLRKSFGPARASVPVLRGVDLTLHRGEVLALLGPNGAGKTTTIRILATLLPPDAGRATVAGYDVVREPVRVRERIGLTGQYAAVDGKQTGRENLTMMGRLSHLPRRAVRDRVAELLDAFDLLAAADRLVSTYSGGMRRRLDLAAGLLTRPEVLFLDEPTTGLDPRSRQTMWEVIRAVVAEGTSLFLTTQYLEEADQLADRVAVVDDGRVVADDTPSVLKSRVGQAGVELWFADADARLVADRVPGATLQERARGEEGATGSRLVRVPTDGSISHVRRVLETVGETGVEPSAWEVREPSLDDVFLTLTGHGARTRSTPATDSTEEP